MIDLDPAAAKTNHDGERDACRPVTVTGDAARVANAAGGGQ